METFLQKKFQPSVTYRLLIIHDGCSKGFGTVQLWPLCSPCTGTNWTSAVKLSLLHGRCTLASSWRVQSPPDGTSSLILLLLVSFKVLGLTPLCPLSLWIYCWFTNPPLMLSSSFCRGFFWHGVLSAVHQAICWQESTLDIWLMCFIFLFFYFFLQKF